MKICLDSRTSTPHFPGIGRYVSNLVSALPQFLQSEDRLDILHDPSHSPIFQFSRSLDARIRVAPIASSPFSISQQWRIPRLLRTLDADIYHSPFYQMPYRTRRPTVLTVYDLIPLRIPGSIPRKASVLFKFLTGLALKTADHVITISEATRQDLLSLFPISPQRVTAVPLAADSQFQPQSAGAIDRVRRKHSLPAQFVLYLGINKPHKNLPRLLQAWSSIYRDLPGPKETRQLVVAGPWDDRYPEAREQVQNLGLAESVRFLGPVTEEDLPGLYCAARCLVLPSLYEGFGLPVLEAMACGTPVACSRSSGLTEIAGNGAHLFDPTDTNAIAETIRLLLMDESAAEETRCRGLERSRNFSWQKTAEATMQIYRKTFFAAAASR